MSNNPETNLQHQQKPRNHYFLRWIATFLLALIVLIGLAILIIWLVLKPKRLVFSVEDAQIHGFNISNDNHLNATYDFVIRSYNPNNKVSIYYDKIESRVWFDDQILALNVHDSFFQGHGNVTRFHVKLGSHSVALLGSIPTDLKLEKSAGEVELSLRIKARIRFRVGHWKSGHRTMRIFCSPIVHFSNSKTFERTICDVEL